MEPRVWFLVQKPFEKRQGRGRRETKTPWLLQSGWLLSSLSPTALGSRSVSKRLQSRSRPPSCSRTLRAARAHAGRSSELPPPPLRDRRSLLTLPSLAHTPRGSRGDGEGPPELPLQLKCGRARSPALNKNTLTSRGEGARLRWRRRSRMSLSVFTCAPLLSRPFKDGAGGKSPPQPLVHVGTKNPEKE